jgi:hypothetical protein
MDATEAVTTITELHPTHHNKAMRVRPARAPWDHFQFFRGETLIWWLLNRRLRGTS